MIRIVTAHEAQHVIAATNELTAHYAVAFTKLHEREFDVTVAGSGTLVFGAERYGILTADHVLEALPVHGAFGLVFMSGGNANQIHRCIIEVDRIQKLRIGKASHDKNGPDLGLVLLEGPQVATLKASNSFYNLEMRKSDVLSAPWPIKDGGWFLVGVAAELTTDLPPEPGFTRVKGFYGICGAGVVTAERRAGGYDYLDFEAKYDESYEGPESYEGFSGGGLWQIRIEEAKGELQLDKAILSGVAFYQSEIQNGVRTIFCHGRRSIYDIVLETLRENSRCRSR